MKTAFKPPTIRDIRIAPEAIDEWYGINVRVTWTEPFPWKAWQDAIRQEENDWFEAHPRQCHVGPWDAERSVVEAVVRQIVQHPAYAEFYAVPRRVRCEEYEDGPERVVTIPRFTERSFSDWGITEQGGWFSASDR